MSSKMGRTIVQDESNKSPKMGRTFVEDGSNFRRRWVDISVKMGQNSVEDGFKIRRTGVEMSRSKFDQKYVQKRSKSGRKEVEEGSAAETVRP